MSLNDPLIPTGVPTPILFRPFLEAMEGPLTRRPVAGPPAPPEAVALLEARTGRRLPAPLRQFLYAWDGARVGGAEILGLAALDAAFAADPAAKRLIPFARDAGRTLYFDPSRPNPKGDPAVVYSGPTGSLETIPVRPGFSEWLNAVIDSLSH